MTSTKPANAKKQVLALLFSGILPVIAFTVIEEKYGVFYGLIAGMTFGIGEILFEKIKYNKVNQITWIGNLLILFLGGISLLADDGIWYKMQPAIFEFGFFIFLFGSWILRKPFLALMIEKQNPETPEFIKSRMSGMTFRLSLFMLIHAILATWAAFYWSTEAWALLKGIGLVGSMFLFMAAEVFYFRRLIKK